MEGVVLLETTKLASASIAVATASLVLVGSLGGSLKLLFSSSTSSDSLCSIYYIVNSICFLLLNFMFSIFINLLGFLDI